MRANGVKEWTVVAGVVICIRGSLECISVATGVKAMPDTSLHNGEVVHDMHAEILALRAFNLYLLEHDLKDFESYLYVSKPPCGDASLSLFQGEVWPSSAGDSTEIIRGRAHFGAQGRIRTKPGRADSALTMSKSCSDKLARRQVQGFACSLLRSKGQQWYLSGLVCPEIPKVDFQRAFGRWEPISQFKWLETALKPPDGDSPTAISLVWTPDLYEVLFNGRLQGSRKPSRLSRLRMAQSAGLSPSEAYYSTKVRNFYPPGWVRTASDDFYPSLSQ